jgi:hypothetical protein
MRQFLVLASGRFQPSYKVHIVQLARRSRKTTAFIFCTTVRHFFARIPYCQRDTFEMQLDPYNSLDEYRYTVLPTERILPEFSG